MYIVNGLETIINEAVNDGSLTHMLIAQQHDFILDLTLDS
jgi:hypothetical protein